MGKDAGGHGSEARGNPGYSRTTPVTSNAEAAASLMGTLNATQAPQHGTAMQGMLDQIKAKFGAPAAPGGARFRS